MRQKNIWQALHMQKIKTHGVKLRIRPFSIGKQCCRPRRKACGMDDMFFTYIKLR